MFKTRKKAISLLLVFSLIFSSLIFCTPYASAKNADELGTELNPYVLSPGEKITVTIDGSKDSDISTLADETFPSCILTTWYDGTYFHWSVKPMFTGANFSGSTNVMRNGIFLGEVYFSGFSGQRRVYKDEMIRLSGTLTQHFWNLLVYFGVTTFKANYTVKRRKFSHENFLLFTPFQTLQTMFLRFFRSG